MIFGYILGSIPSAYLAGRWIKGVDLRHRGSGTVSGTGVYYHAAPWAIVPVGIFDIAKAALPTWLGLRLGLGLPIALAAGLAAVIGHDWPLYLGFKGGRGISPFMGVMLVTFPWGFPWLLIFLGIGKLLRYTAIAALVGIGALPLLTWGLEKPPAVTWTCVAMLLLTVIKRLEANRLPLPPPGSERRQVLLRRLLLDRDTEAREAWVHRFRG
ncbi:MAG: glycerol-3-phosphate acyltransferase [Chloroflexota bacterium]|nr:glycerol-3-phosphate acyltransferase [Chloroflexota bacterium]